MTTPSSESDLVRAYSAWKERQAAIDADSSALKALRTQLERISAVRVAPDPASIARQRVAKKAAQSLRKGHRLGALAGRELEDRALRKSAKAVRKALDAGQPKDEAINVGLARYLELGGRQPTSAWRRQVLGQ